MIHEISLHSPSTLLEGAYINSFNKLSLKSDQLNWIYLGNDAEINTPINNFNSYVQVLLKRETEPAPGFVCDTIWWAIYKNQMVGRIAFRHELNDFLKKIGGHIGYIVHPEWRNKGIATWMLKEVLKTNKVKNVKKILLTCDVCNIASEKTIIRNGGVFEKIIDLGPSRPAKKHFWISTELK